MNMRNVRLAATTAATSIALTTVTAAAALADPIKKPDPTRASDAPGVKGLEQLADALVLYGLIGCVIGALVSAIAMGAGGAISDRIRESGKIGLLVCVGVAFLIGIIWAVINWAYGAGNS